MNKITHAPSEAERTQEAIAQRVERGDSIVSVSGREPSKKEREERGLHSGDGKIFTITVRAANGHELVLNDLVPAGWIFVQTEPDPLYRGVGNGAVANSMTKVIRFPHTTSHNFFKRQGAMLMLLHECGHANEPEKDMPTLFRDAMHRTVGSNTLDIIQEADDKAIRGYLDTVTGAERDAWAFALHQYRDARARGINLEPDMNLAEMLLSIGDALGTYSPTANPEKLDRLRREMISERSRAGARDSSGDIPDADL